MQIKIEIDPRKKLALRNGFASCEIVIDELGVRKKLFLPYEKFHRYGGARETLADDFLFVSSICYAVDLLVPRKLTQDRWTREIQMEIPVKDPTLWNTYSSLFIKLLSFLTGDQWTISYKQREVPLYINRKKRRKIHHRPAQTVCLFSGGLDSFLGAISHLSTSIDHTVFVGHYDTGLARKSQTALFEGIASKFGAKRAHLFQVYVVERFETKAGFC